MRKITLTLFMAVGCYLQTEAQTTLINRSDLGPFNARQRSISLQIDYTDPNRWYLGTEGGGLWISSNAGNDWNKLDPSNKLGTKVIDIAQDFDDPNVIVYAAPIKSNMHDYNFPNPGLYKSTDNGVSFTQLTAATNSVITEFTPHDLQIVNSKTFLQTTSGIYKIANDGTPIEIYNSPSKTVQRMEVLKENNTTEHILYTENKNTIYKGTDTGGFTAVLTNPSAAGIDIGFSLSNPSIVYAVIALNGTYGPGARQIHKSTNYGATWTIIYDRPAGTDFCPTTDIVWNYDDFNGLWVDDNDPNKLIITSTDMAYSGDGGLNWFYYKQGGSTDERASIGDFWPQSFQRNPINGKLVLGSDQGLAEGTDAGIFDFTGGSVEATYGVHFIDKTNSVNAFTAYVGSYIGDTGNDFVIAGQDRGAWLSKNGTLKFVGGADVYNLIATDNHIHTFNKHGSHLLENYTQSGVLVSDVLFNDTHVDTYNTGNQAGQAENVVYYANDYPHDVTNEHYLLKAIGPNYDSFSIVYQTSTKIKSVATHPTSGNTYLLEGSTIKRINNATGVATTLVTGAFVSEIEIDMGNENIIYGFSTSGTLYKFDLTTGTKIDISGTKNFVSPLGTSATIEHLSFVALNENLMYLGTDYGVFSSIDMGQNWLKETSFPEVMVFDIDIRTSDHRLYAFTYGMGAIAMHIDPTILSIKDQTGIANPNDFNFTMYPNPSIDQLNISSENWKGNTVTVSIFTVDGKILKEYTKNRNEFDRNNTFSVAVNELATGSYLLQVKDEKSALIKPFVKK